MDESGMYALSGVADLEGVCVVISVLPDTPTHSHERIKTIFEEALVDLAARAARGPTLEARWLGMSREGWAKFRKRVAARKEA